MIIAVTSNGTDLNAPVDSRFGRAANFIVVDTETERYTVVENHQNLDLPQGAGIQAALTVARQEVDVLITGNCGPKAFRVLSEAGIQTVVGAGGSVREAITQYTAGELTAAAAPNVEGHWG